MRWAAHAPGARRQTPGASTGAGRGERRHIECLSPALSPPWASRPLDTKRSPNVSHKFLLQVRLAFSCQCLLYISQPSKPCKVTMELKLHCQGILSSTFKAPEA